ncbi:uncharacterized protein LOC135835655 isoform X2 [Planococcus citri]|uniref:uncharacterized protein LOC135835655 isoform X2 n=1 Tax=Planococcus citri TaxID=170843 RepID=UPI0031FA29C5
MDKDKIDVRSILAKAEEFRSICLSNDRERCALKEALNTAHSRIAELERDLAKSRQETRKAEADRDDLRIALEKLQSVFTGDPNSPQDKNTGDVPSSFNPFQSRSTADEVHSILATPTSKREIENQIPSPLSKSNDGDAAVVHHEDVIPEEKEPRIESNSEFICNNEIANDISNYFSSFVVDPQTSSEENLLMSAIPSSIKMVLNSYQSFDRKYLVFVIIETATDSKSCHFLSIDDLLALPENEDLLAQLQASQLMSSMPDVGKNYVFFTVVSHLITRSMTSLSKTNPAHDADASTSDITNDHTEPADGDTITVKEKVAVKRRGAPRGPRKKLPAKKIKPSCVSEVDTDIDYVASVASSTDYESEEFKSDFEIKSSTADKKSKTRCRVCDIVDHEVNYFHSYQALNCHIIEAHPFNAYPYYYRCPYGDNGNECIRHYTKKISLRKHIEACHPDVLISTNILLNTTNPKPKSWQCAYCGCTFASHRIYLKHMTDTHPGFAETVKVSASAKTLESEPQVKSKKVPSSPKLIIKRKQGKFSVSRKSSLSSIDEDYVPEEVGSPPTRRRKLFLEEDSLEEDSSPNTVVVSAEIHSVSNVESFTSEIEKSSVQNNDLVDVEDKSNQAFAASSDPADLNEFVLNSVYEISSLINQNVADDRHPATSSILPEPCYEKPQSSVLPSLPCLLDDCSGCEFHPKTLTLDDEYVSSCREEILKDLYSIPENPPAVSSSFTAPLSKSEYDSEETDKSKRDGSLINSQSSNLVDGFDIVNIIITDDRVDSDVPSASSEIDPQSDENDSDQPPLPKDSSQLLNPVIDDGVIQSAAVIEAENEESRSDILSNTSHAPGDDGEKNVSPSENENCTIVEEIECTEDNNHEKLVPNEEQSILRDDRISSDIQVTSSDDEIIPANEKPLLDNDETILAESVTGNSIPAVPSTDPSPTPNHENIDETAREDTNATAMISSDTENLITTPILSVNETLLQIPEKCQHSNLNENPEPCIRPRTPTISENHDRTAIPEISASEDAVDSEDVPPTDPILCPMNPENISAPANLVSITTDETFRENTVVASDTENPMLPISSENETSLEIPEKRQHSSFDEMPELCVSPEAISPYPDGSPADDTSTSNLNSTFYDEFGVSEIQTINEKEPSQEITPSSVLTELDLSSQKSNHGTEKYPLLRNMLTPRSSTIRCTNQIIDGVGIEIEIGPHSSSPSSSQTSDLVNIQSPYQKEPPSSVEIGVDATSKLASYPVLNLNTDFSSMLNRMLTDQSLGKLSNEIVEKTRVEIDASRSSSPTSECSKSSENLEQVQEKDNFEDDDVSEIGSVPASSPLPSPPDQMSSNDTNATEHQIAETAVENSPLTMSSNQCGLDNEEDPDAKYYSALTSRDRLIKVTILLPRLRIEKNRPISSRYHLRGQKSIGQLISSARGRGAKLRRKKYSQY